MLSVKNIEDVTNDFPILKRRIHGKPIVYLDNAATSQRPIQVIDSVVNFYKNYNANIHRGVHTLSLEASDMYEESRNIVANFISAKPEEVIFTKNTTESINLISYAYALSNSLNLSEKDEIVITEMEHHSNILPWQMVAEKTGAKLKFIPVTKDGTLDLSDIDKYITENTKIVSVAQASNVLGTVNDVKLIGKMAHENGAVMIVDGAQSVPHMPINVKRLDCDFFAFSGHKMLGPFGIGGLYIKKEISEDIKPFMLGGGMIGEVKKERSTFTHPPGRFEAGTPNVVGAIGLAEAVKYLKRVGMENVYKHEKKLTEYMLEKLKNVNNVDINIYGSSHESKNERVGVVSFNVDGMNPEDVGMYLSEQGVFVRTGHHCAQVLMSCLGVRGTVRASMYLYNNENDVDRFVSAIKKI